MSEFESRMAPRLAGLIVVGLVCAFAAAHDMPGAQAAAAASAIPNFAPNRPTGWAPARASGDDFISPERGPGPVVAEKEHPYVPNGQGQPTYRIADLSNPGLMPWVVERMKERTEG